MWQKEKKEKLEKIGKKESVWFAVECTDRRVRGIDY